MEEEKLKKVVREGYGKIAEKESCCCDLGIGREIGYTEEELRSVPEGAFSLGCGNVVGFASLEAGETVLDLGSGLGLDCFLAAKKVGGKGRVIGVDMTPEMIDKARENARKGNYRNVEFRLGEIENLPVADSSIDVIVSNCVINLSPNKRRVFKEAFRVLKPGGRLMISDIVLSKELPEAIKKSVKAYIGCLSGAIMKDKYINVIKEAGFQQVKIIEEARFPIECLVNDSTAKFVMENSNISIGKVREIADSVVSIEVYGVKPK